MRQTLSRGAVVAATATSILNLCGSAAFADSDADGATIGSPGVLSGNNVQAPVSVPVNVCGNSVDVVGVLNPAFGNFCGHTGASDGTPSQSDADGATIGSPGVLSGNNVQAPVSVPVNACGNSVDVVSVLNPAFGNSCGHVGSDSGASVGIPSQSGAVEPVEPVDSGVSVGIPSQSGAVEPVEPVDSGVSVGIPSQSGAVV
ncbi:chaplin, partial [Streptomyces sp. NPDC002845]